ncbi:MAG: erythromycin esterase family protein, partial [Bacteroidales bacterium]|nr:erythromycin esterase family protein [Bacteroidales bacterium]
MADSAFIDNTFRPCERAWLARAARRLTTIALCLLAPTLHAVEADDEAVAQVLAQARPLVQPADLDDLVATMAGHRLVLLGESTHGTHEYYLWRDAISRRLVANHGFSFIAVEGDFPAIHDLNRFVKNLPGAAASAREILTGFDRFPAWMWGNEEFLALVEWLRTYNDQRPPHLKVGLYGMDVYNEWRARDELLQVLAAHDPDTHAQVARHYQCFDAYQRDSWRYARAVQEGAADCSQATLDALETVKAAGALAPLADNGHFFAVQNARVKHNAEKFYRKSQGNQHSAAWNARASHMHDTVTRLMGLYGDDARGIVWAHNTHVGDAHYTSMRNQQQHNIGQLSRRQWGDDQVFLLGFSTHSGTVKAARGWGARRQLMTIPAPQPGSLEDLLARTGLDRYYLLFGDDRRQGPLAAARGHRAVGVVYDPENDPRQFVDTIAAMRYDALVFLRHTR